jgi:hypothetical protein
MSGSNLKPTDDTMISPTGWMLKRPGIWIPVFFLSLAQPLVTCQALWPEAASAALGGCYVTMQGFSCTTRNQAGLGLIEQSSVSIQHSMPFLIKEVGQSSLSGQFRTGTGAIGVAFASRGFRGFRQTSAWLSYGMKLRPQICAGVGIHLWYYTIAEQFIYAPGISFALGLQVRINNQWTLGGSLFHPAGWSTLPISTAENHMSISAGFLYTFLGVGRFYSEIHIQSLKGIGLSNGLEWTLLHHTILRMGVYYRPFTFSAGTSLKFTKWVLGFSFQYRSDSGLSPYTSLSHAW